MASLMRAIASSRASTPDSAKNAVCMMVLMRTPMLFSRASAYASMACTLSFFRMISFCTRAGMCSHTASGG